MRKLVYYVAVTLDGKIAGPDGGDPSGESYLPVPPDLVEFIVEHYPETLPGPARQAMGIDGPGKVFDTVIEGRNTHEIGLAAGLANAYPHLRHLVFSSSMGSSTDPAIEVVSTDAVRRVRELKGEDGKDIWLVGGGKLAHSLLPEIDQMVLKHNPSVIGSGIPMFDGPFAAHTFRPVDHVVLQSGVRVVTYDRV